MGIGDRIITFLMWAQVALVVGGIILGVYLLYLVIFMV